MTFFTREMRLSGFTDAKQVIVHECGHAIGGLTDQYDQYGQLRVSENFTYDSDPKAAPWSMFFSLENYKGRVGFYERNGGYYPSPTSIMDKHNSCKWFDSPSRYALWYNCHLIAGLPMAAVWEDFLKYDRVNDGIQY